MTFNIWVHAGDGRDNLVCERLDAAGCTISPDGSLIFLSTSGGNAPPIAVYNPNYWCKCEPATIQSGKAN